jgi:aminopeptidase N
MARYFGSQNSIEQRNIMTGLGCSRDVYTMNAYLMTIVDEDSPVRKQDGIYVFNAVAASSWGNPVAWDWMRGNWAMLRAEQDNGNMPALPKMVESVAAPFNTAKRLSELEAFLAANAGNLGSADKAFETAIANTKLNVGWMENYAETIVEWLKEHHTD